MASTEFKLCRRKGITRRVAFPERPTWNTLAARISELYAIPLDRVAVSYLDADEDEVTLNTQEELTHFYQTCKPSSIIRLFVQDLLAIRSRPVPIPMSMEPIDDEWWRSQPWEGDAVFVPDLTIRSSQHGFVEEVDSDAEAASKLSSRKSATNEASKADKGKGKAEIAKEADRSSRLSAAEHLSGFRNSDTSTPVLAESTPKPSLSAAGNLETDVFESAATEDVHVIDDPPLPSIDPDAPSLPDDISNFFSSLCNVISSHPEVSEGFRNIILNASNGTYWRAHREALSHAAAEATQASETVMQDVLHESEAEAGRRVFNAFDAVFRTISQATGVRRAATEPNPLNEAVPANEDGETATRSDVPPSSTKPATGPDDKGSAKAQIPKQEKAPFVGRSTDWQSFLTPIFPPPPPLAPNVHVPRAHAHPFMSSLRFPPPPPPPPPPGLAFIPPPATGVPSPFPPAEAPSPPEPPGHDFPSPFTRDELFPGSYSTPASPTDPRVAEMAELRAKVHAAKTMYRAEKARYLQEREQARKREKGKDKYGVELNETGEMRAFEGLQSLIDANEAVSQVISNARGSFPQLGMISIPGPFSPAHRHGSLREGTDDFRSRAVKRICKQLADMGFSESQHPGLADTVSARLPPNGSVTKDVEDGILTSLLEELLPLASPVASGSGPRAKGRN